MKTILAILLAVSVLTVTTQAAEFQKLADWCSIACTNEAKIGQVMEVQVKLEGIKPGTKLKADLHWVDKAGKVRGANTWGGPPQDVKEGAVYTFKLKPVSKPDIGSVRVLVFLTPSGEWKDLTQKAMGSDIKIVE
jgi:hypothetical protein